MDNAKPWWQSKTLWFNVVVAVLGGVELAGNLIQPYVPGNIYAWGMGALIAGNAGLRVISASALTLK